MGTIALMLVLSSFPAAQIGTGNQDPNGSALQEMASELRQMRQSLGSLRTQVLALRVQVQEQRVAQAASRLEAIRSQLAQLEPEQAEVAKRINFLQDAIAKTQPPFTPAPNQARLNEAMVQSDQLVRKESQLRGQESDADTGLRKEQAMWADLSRQLADAEQTVAPAAAVRPQ